MHCLAHAHPIPSQLIIFRSGSLIMSMNLNWLFFCVPLAVVLSWFDTNPILVFLASALSVIPLARLMGDATEELSRHMGSAAGGLLNATMGTIPDIIIGLFALHHGLVEVVKASITGGIVGNLLLGLGLAIVLGGLKHLRGLSFDSRTSHLMSGLMLLASIGLIIPAIFDFSTDSETEISLSVAVVMLLTYVFSVIFTLTNSAPEAEVGPLGISPYEVDQHNTDLESTSASRAAFILMIATTVLAFMSELLTGSLQPAASTLGLTPIFTGIFLLAPIGGAVEIINAVRFARRNKLDLSLTITIGSSTQMALVASPVLVFAGLAMGQPMNLLFSRFQVVAIILAVVAVNNSLNMGQVRWISGIKLIAIYLILGIGFYYEPSSM